MQAIEKYNATLKKVQALLDPESSQYKAIEMATENARILYETLDGEVADLVEGFNRLQDVSDALEDKTDIIIRQTILETSVPEVTEYLEATKKFKTDLPFLLLKLQLEVEEKAANLAVLMQNYHLADTNFKKYKKQCELLKNNIAKGLLVGMTIGQIKELLGTFIDETGAPLFSDDELYDFIEIISSGDSLNRFEAKDKKSKMVEVDIPDEDILEYCRRASEIFVKDEDEQSKIVIVDVPDEDIAEYCRKVSERLDQLIGETETNSETEIQYISIPDEEESKSVEEEMVDLDKAMEKDPEQLSDNGQMLVSMGKLKKDVLLVDKQLVKMSRKDLEDNITVFEDAGIDLEMVNIVTLTYPIEQVREHVANVLYLQKILGKDHLLEKFPVLLCNISNEEMARRLKEAAEYFIGVEDERDIRKLLAPSDLSTLLADTVEMYGENFENIVQGKKFAKIIFPNAEEMAMARENSSMAFKKYFGEEITDKLNSYKEGQVEPDLFRLTDFAEKIALAADEIRPGYYKVGGHWIAKSRIENNLKRILASDFEKELSESEIIEMAITYGSLNSTDILVPQKTLGGVA